MRGRHHIDFECCRSIPTDRKGAAAGQSRDRLPQHSGQRGTAALAATTTPVVFASGGDPVKLGLVSSGLYYLLNELVKKRIALLHELVPQVRRIAVFVDPSNPAEGEPTARDATAFDRELGLETRVFNATTAVEVNEAFAAIKDWRADALFVARTRSSASRRRFSSS
jgi:putative ABC transport system substrate-binding protein